MPTKKDKDPETERLEAAIDEYMDSKSVQKMWAYFLEVTKSDYFNNFVSEMRGKYHFPAKGIMVVQDSEKHTPPRGFTQEDELRREIIERICKKFRLHYADYADIITFHIYYNEIRQMYALGSYGLFRVSDVPSETKEPFGEEFQESDRAAYPIAIMMSPYASQRDLIDFIKNKTVWKNEFEFLQKKYRDPKVKIGRVKKKKDSIQERNEFIYQNRTLPLKKIMSLLADKKIYIDEGHIAKIISLEKQKRKDV